MRHSPGRINRPKLRKGPELLIVGSQLAFWDLVDINRERKIVAVACDIAKRSHQIRVQLSLYLQVPLIRTTHGLMVLDIIYILTIEYSRVRRICTVWKVRPASGETNDRGYTVGIIG